MVARLQEIKAGTAVVAVPRTEAQRMGAWDTCAKARRMAVWHDCADTGAQRMAVRTEGPRGWLCRQMGPEAETSLLHADSF